MPSRFRLILGFATVYIVWGSTYLAIRFAIETLPPFSMAGVRFIVAGAVLHVWAMMRGAARPERKHWVAAAVVGLLLLLGGNGGVVWAEQRVDSGVAALLVAVVPCWMVLLDWLRPEGVRPRATVVGGLVLGLAGVALLVGPAALLGTSRIDPLGAGVLVLASLSWAAGSIRSRHTPAPASPILASAMQMLAGGAGLFVLGVVTGELGRVDPAAVSARSVLALLYLIVFGSFIGFTTYMWLLRVSTPARVSTYAYVNPVVAVILGWALADEDLNARIVLAATVIVAGVALITLTARRDRAPAPADACAPTPGELAPRRGSLRSRLLAFSRRGAGLLLALLLLGCGRARTGGDAGAAAMTPGDHEISLRHGGRTRIALVHVPPAAARATALPLLIALHGGGGEAAGFREYAGLDAVADREGFVVVYPYGTGPLPRRLLTWNAGAGCCGYARDRNIDDVAFLMLLVDDVARRTPIDASRIHATGHSNGAMMVYRLAAERADRIAAIAPVAGAMDVATFAPSRPVPVLHIHSVDDPRALYNGGLGPPFPLTDNRVQHRAVTAGLDAWIRVNGCAAAPRVIETRTGRDSEDGQTATLLSWAPCTSGAEVRHWKLSGAGHGWPGDAGARMRDAIIGPPTGLVSAAEEVWDFVSRFRTN